MVIFSRLTRDKNRAFDLLHGVVTVLLLSADLIENTSAFDNSFIQSYTIVFSPADLVCQVI